jgi:hypothetical protein
MGSPTGAPVLVDLGLEKLKTAKTLSLLGAIATGSPLGWGVYGYFSGEMRRRRKAARPDTPSGITPLGTWLFWLAAIGLVVWLLAR